MMQAQLLLVVLLGKGATKLASCALFRRLSTTVPTTSRGCTGWRLLLLLFVVFVISPSSSMASEITAPVSVKTNMGWDVNFFPKNLINQSGLSTPYTSNVTDFDSYLATNPLHAPMIVNSWATLTKTGFVAFDLGFFGPVLTVDRIAIWNPLVLFAVNSFTLHADGVALGSFDLTVGSQTPQVISFTPTNAAARNEFRVSRQGRSP